MYNREEMREQLKQKAKDEVFLAKFNEQVNQDLQRLKAGTKYAQQVDPFNYQWNPTVRALKRFTIEGDDELNTKKWHSFMTDCAFYYDRPTVDQERQMRWNLQYKYDDLFSAGVNPKLQTRKDLLTWACKTWENEKKERAPEDQRETINDRCEDYGYLLQTYGPDYSSLKKKLGYVRGLFNDSD